LKVVFRSSFARDLRKLRDEEMRRRVQQLILLVENASSLDDVPGAKRLQHQGVYFCVRLGDYRVGIVLDDNTVTFVRFLYRRDIYRYFP